MSPNPLLRALNVIAPLAEKDASALLACARPRTLRQGDHLLRAGAESLWFGLVQQGVIREYFTLPTGHERTKSFAVEEELVGSLPDALAGRPATCSIVAEVETQLLMVSCTQFFAWLETNPTTQRWGRALLQRQYLRKADRELELVVLDAWSRYQAFRLRFPGLEARVSQRVVASYVGVSAVHLSRLRSGHRGHH